MVRITRGFTLVELLVTILVVSILATTAAPLFAKAIARQSLIARANNLVGFIYMAREKASEGNPVMLCALDQACAQFADTRHLALVEDRNHNERFDDADEILAELVLPEAMQVSWRSFRRKPWLRFTHQARSHYQNGHFLLCQEAMGIKVIITRIGRPRVEKGGVKEALCQPGN